jgi:hypothetical protein
MLLLLLSTQSISYIVLRPGCRAQNKGEIGTGSVADGRHKKDQGDQPPWKQARPRRHVHHNQSSSPLRTSLFEGWKNKMRST